MAPTSAASASLESSSQESSSRESSSQEPSSRESASQVSSSRESPSQEAGSIDEEAYKAFAADALCPESKYYVSYVSEKRGKSLECSGCMAAQVACVVEKKTPLRCKLCVGKRRICSRKADFLAWAAHKRFSISLRAAEILYATKGGTGARARASASAKRPQQAEVGRAGKRQKVGMLEKKNRDEQEIIEIDSDTDEDESDKASFEDTSPQSTKREEDNGAESMDNGSDDGHPPRVNVGGRVGRSLSRGSPEIRLLENQGGAVVPTTASDEEGVLAPGHLIEGSVIEGSEDGQDHEAVAPSITSEENIDVPANRTRGEVETLLEDNLVHRHRLLDAQYTTLAAKARETEIELMETREQHRLSQIALGRLRSKNRHLKEANTRLMEGKGRDKLEQDRIIADTNRVLESAREREDKWQAERSQWLFERSHERAQIRLLQERLKARV